MTLLAMPAIAQTPMAGGPFAGLFGGRTNAGHTLDLRGSLFTAYQETIFPDDVPAGVGDPLLDLQGSTLGAAGSLSYAYRRIVQGSNLYFGGRGTVSKFSAAPDEIPWDVSVNTGVSTRLSQSVTFSGSADAGYSPFFGFTTFDQGYSPGGGFGQSPPLVGQTTPGATLFEPTLNYGGQVSLSSSLTRQTTLSGSADWREYKLLENSLQSTSSYSVGGNLTHQLWRYVGLRAGYRRQVTMSAFPGTGDVVSNIIDAGVDFNYSRGFDLDRRTTVTFGTSSSLITSNGDTHFRVNGTASITRGIGRTWMAGADYRRESGYQLGFRDVVLSDSATASLTGLLTRRLSSNTYASWQRGQVGFDSGATFSTYTASTGLNYGLTRHLGLYAQYSRFFYTVPPAGVTLPFFERYSRQIVSAGLTAYVPLINAGRMTRDSR